MMSEEGHTVQGGGRESQDAPKSFCKGDGPRILKRSFGSGSEVTTLSKVMPPFAAVLGKSWLLSSQHHKKTLEQLRGASITQGSSTTVADVWPGRICKVREVSIYNVLCSSLV